MKNFKLNLKSIVQSNARGKKRKEKDERVLTMKEASVQHPFSIHSASIAIRRQSGGKRLCGSSMEVRGYAADAPHPRCGTDVGDVKVKGEG